MSIINAFDLLDKKPKTFCTFAMKQLNPDEAGNLPVTDTKEKAWQKIVCAAYRP
jgi:hypothetical protein